MSKVFQRGFDINDKKWFSNKEIIKLSKAKEEIEWLINRDYKIDSVVNFVGDRYQFSLRQRNALKRAICTEGKKLLRKSKLLDVNKINEDTIYIDGFNLIITLEVALSKFSKITSALLTKITSVFILYKFNISSIFNFKLPELDTGESK